MKYRFILKLAEEFEAKLREQMEKEQDLSFEEAYLLSLGAIPAGGEGSYLGRGNFSSAYRVIYQGKPAVAKITQSINDIKALEKLSAIKDSLPSDLRKHILNVYKIQYADNSLINKQFQSLPIRQRLRRPTLLPHVAIVEELEPLSSDILKNIFIYESELNNDTEEGDSSKSLEEEGNKRYNDIINKIKSNNQFLKAFTRGVLLSEKNKFKNFITNKDVFLNLFNKTSEILYSFNYPSLYEDFISEPDENGLIHLTMLIKHNIINILQDNLITGANTSLIEDYATYCSQNKIFNFFKSLFTGLFPREYTYPDLELRYEILKTYPEIKSMIKLLKILKNKYNISFIDLSQENLMQRKNKDIVISDPGLFEFG